VKFKSEPLNQRVADGWNGPFVDSTRYGLQGLVLLDRGIKMELDLFVSRDWREIDLVIENSDSAIAIHGSGFTEAEDVLGRSVRLGE